MGFIFFSFKILGTLVVWNSYRQSLNDKTKVELNGSGLPPLKLIKHTIQELQKAPADKTAASDNWRECTYWLEELWS